MPRWSRSPAGTQKRVARGGWQAFAVNDHMQLARSDRPASALRPGCHCLRCTRHAGGRAPLTFNHLHSRILRDRQRLHDAIPFQLSASERNDCSKWCKGHRDRWKVPPEDAIEDTPIIDTLPWKYCILERSRTKRPRS
jgi:hypothetical protein